MVQKTIGKESGAEKENKNSCETHITRENGRLGTR